MGALIWLSWALLAPLGPILGHFRSQVAVQLRLWALPWPNKDFPNPIFCAPTANLASFAKPSTCPKYNKLKGLCKVCHLPTSQHVNLNLTLQSPKTMDFMFMSKHVYQESHKIDNHCTRQAIKPQSNKTTNAPTHESSGSVRRSACSD